MAPPRWPGLSPTAAAVDAGVYGGDPTRSTRWIAFVVGLVPTLLSRLSLDAIDRLDRALIAELQRRGRQAEIARRQGLLTAWVDRQARLARVPV